MHAIIIGDIVRSRSLDAQIWLPVLGELLQKYANRFDIFRGDSFQADISLERCFEFVFCLKAHLKSLGVLDVRVGVGVGKVEYQDEHIKSSNGQAFILSGEAFDSLRKELIAVRTPWDDYDEPVNIMLGLTMALADRWTVNMAESVAVAITNPSANQQELAHILKRKYQSQISTELNKAYFNKILSVIDYCTQELIKRC